MSDANGIIAIFINKHGEKLYEAKNDYTHSTPWFDFGKPVSEAPKRKEILVKTDTGDYRVAYFDKGRMWIAGTLVTTSAICWWPLPDTCQIM